MISTLSIITFTSSLSNNIDTIDNKTILLLHLSSLIVFHHTNYHALLMHYGHWSRIVVIDHFVSSSFITAIIKSSHIIIFDLDEEERGNDNGPRASPPSSVWLTVARITRTSFLDCFVPLIELKHKVEMIDWNKTSFSTWKVSNPRGKGGGWEWSPKNWHGRSHMRWRWGEKQ